MIVNQKYAPPASAPEPEKSQFPGDRSAISGLRYYSPSLGRFINQDPIEEDGGLNLYSFAGNDGVNGYDLLGLTVLTMNFGNIVGDIYGPNYTANGSLNVPAWYVAGSVSRSGGTFKLNLPGGLYSIAATAGTDQSIIDIAGYDPKGYYVYRGFAFPNTFWNSLHNLYRGMVDDFYNDLPGKVSLKPPVFNPNTGNPGDIYTPAYNNPGGGGTVYTPNPPPTPIDPNIPTIGPADDNTPSQPNVGNLPGGVSHGILSTAVGLINSGSWVNPNDFASQAVNAGGAMALDDLYSWRGYNTADPFFQLGSSSAQLSLNIGIAFAAWPENPLAGDLPLQFHHFATNKSLKYTPAMSGIARNFGLGLDEPWNMELMSHSGRHPNAMHDFVLSGMRRAAAESGGDTARFLRLFNQYVKQPIRQNPQLLRKAGWQK